ncbi:MAG: (2Fe-2S)-binding protein [Alphaproteobacteria bacterium]|jgi:carbon-monoxide dehydrogenase small subunit|uniref:(2Fe-2S)-binding protein n=1 Tax=Peteryoungia algae TaxID=2919917 RepID=A0ABT0D3Z5_9HYPH|nr:MULTISPECIES: (2Fe-2S)-binding protein [unclassified Rhizobium]MBU2329686.1 (2Fe-2S)-binding protein [Alphaproteobacteria bacterium]MCC8932942.1 (2Fe-2S)-binding protein [Rhizobium sp. 'Codium 1']MCJ8240014.1 (2Fe-2S)-binding protein [Rhizobium sp. SSM4.3]
MAKVTLTVNGRTVSGECEDRTLLVHFIRDKLGLTGTHVGCDTTQCGTCVVHMDGKSIKSCSILAVQASGSSITTIEGISSGGELHPVQAAFKEHHGLQCGFCTPGMVMTALDMICRHNGALDEATVRQELEGNICRCTGYHNIVKAVLSANEAMTAGRQAAE